MQSRAEAAIAAVTARITVKNQGNLVPLHVVDLVVRIEEGHSECHLAGKGEVAQRHKVVVPGVEESSERHLVDDVVDLELDWAEFPLCNAFCRQKSVFALPNTGDVCRDDAANRPIQVFPVDLWHDDKGCTCVSQCESFAQSESLSTVPQLVHRHFPVKAATDAGRCEVLPSRIVQLAGLLLFVASKSKKAWLGDVGAQQDGELSFREIALLVHVVHEQRASAFVPR